MTFKTTTKRFPLSYTQMPIDFLNFICKMELHVFQQTVILERFGRANYLFQLNKIAEDLFCGSSSNYIVNLPPRTGKSRYMCVYFLAYGLALNPTAHSLYISYSEPLIRSHINLLKLIIESEYYQKLFPYVKVSRNARSWKLLQTNHGGQIACATIRGAMTGFGAGKTSNVQDAISGKRVGFNGAVIIDDPHNAADAASKKALDVSNQFFSEVLTTRRNDLTTPYLIVHQRISEFDLTAHVESNHPEKNWKKLVLPAICDDGEVLFPKTMNKSELLTLKNVNPSIFWAQYQQEPMSGECRIFQTDKFRYFTLEEIKDKVVGCVISADCATGSEGTADRTAFSCFLVFFETPNSPNPSLYWLDVMADKIKSLELVERFLHFHDRIINGYGFEVDYIIIEKHSLGIVLEEALKDRGFNNVIGTTRAGKRESKIENMQRAASFVASGTVCLAPEPSPQLLVIKEELNMISLDGRHERDDIADTLVEVVKIIFLKRYIRFYPKENDTITLQEARNNINGTRYSFLI